MSKHTASITWTRDGQAFTDNRYKRSHITYKKGSSPDEKTDREMHHQAHGQCFIANSVKSKIRVDSTMSERSED